MSHQLGITPPASLLVLRFSWTAGLKRLREYFVLTWKETAETADPYSACGGVYLPGARRPQQTAYGGSFEEAWKSADVKLRLEEL